MQTDITSLPKSQRKLTITLAPEEYARDLERAAQEMEKAKPMPGFRPGKTPYSILKLHFGEGAILEQALQKIVARTYVSAVKEKQLKTVGPPEITPKTVAPGNPLVYDAVVSILPAVTLPDLAKIEVARKEKQIGEKEVDETLAELQKMRASEVITGQPVGDTDKVIIDMDILHAGVPLEGGQAKDHAVYMDEAYYIPGLKEQITGIKKGEIKEFDLPFPDAHYNKQLAGRNAHFKITVKDVFSRTLPALDDAFALGLGQKTMADLRALILKNMTLEAARKADERATGEMLEKLTDATVFDELPETLLDAEKERMIAELQGELTERGTNLDDYLTHLKKTAQELADGMTDKAVRRVKQQLLLREFVAYEGITVSEQEFDEELKKVRAAYKENEQIDERLADSEIREFIRSNLAQRKAIEALRGKIIGSPTN